MNQNLVSDHEPLPRPEQRPERADDWQPLSDVLLAILEHWRLLVAVPLAAGAIAYAGSFLLPKTYSSYAYIGPLDAGTGRQTLALMVSPPVLNVALQKLARPPLSSMTAEQGRRYLEERVRLTPASGADPKAPSLLVAEVTAEQPLLAHDILAAVIDSWLTAMKPLPDKLERLKRLQDAMAQQSSDLSKAIEQLMKRPELLSGDIKTGYAPINVAEMIKLRTDGLEKGEDLKATIAGLPRGVIALGPTMPERPVGPLRWKLAGVAIAGTLAFLIAAISLRELLLPYMAGILQTAKLQRAERRRLTKNGRT